MRTRFTTALLCLITTAASGTLLYASSPAIADPSPSPAMGAAPVDDARLLAAGNDPRNWLMPGASYADLHYSALAQVSRANVASLAPAWSFHTGRKGTFEATPLAIDGVVYLTTAFDDVVALDAERGTLLWRYTHVLRSKPCCGPANRGAGAGYGRIYLATVDARLIALDQRTGTVDWDVPLTVGPGGDAESTHDLAAGDALRTSDASGQSGVFANMAPLVYRGKVIVGITGVGYGLHVAGLASAEGGVVGFAGAYGHRGFYAAYDAATGKEVWRWYTIPPSGWEGAFAATTPDGAALPRDPSAERAALPANADAWKTGGGSAWTTPAVDPGLGLLYAGVGNPSPQFQDDTRPGDNLYSVSVVALDIATGTLRWSFQQVPHDLWGYDVASPLALFNTTVNGRIVPAVGQAGKTGWYYVFDRRTGALIRKSEAFVPQQHLFAAPTVAGVDVAPGAAGGSNWSPAAYDPATGLVYVEGVHIPMHYQIRTSTDAGGHVSHYTEMTDTPGVPHFGTLSAIDTQTGAIRWQYTSTQPLVGGTLVTAGGLVFAGEANGNLDAFDAKSGALVWQGACGAGVNAPPIAYEVDGREYVAVAAGGNQLFGFTGGDTFDVFALPSKS